MPKNWQFGLVMRGVLMAAFFAIVLSAGLGLLLSFTSIPETNLGSNLIYITSVFAAALMNANRAGTKGLYYGLGIGLGFAIFALAVVAVFRATPPAWLEIGEKTILSLVSGGVGGIVGVLVRHG